MTEEAAAAARNLSEAWLMLGVAYVELYDAIRDPNAARAVTRCMEASRDWSNREREIRTELERTETE